MNAAVTGPEMAIAEGVMNDGTRFAADYDVASDGAIVYVPGSSIAEESRMAYVNADGTTTPLTDDRQLAEPALQGGVEVGDRCEGEGLSLSRLRPGSQRQRILLTGGDTVTARSVPTGRRSRVPSTATVATASICFV